MKFKEIASRLTGFSIPIFGVSWDPPEVERTIAKRVIAHLEDRRVLYNPSEMEIPDHCARSVIEIRHLLSAEIAAIDESSPLSGSLRAMRAACRKFMDTVGRDERIIQFGAHQGHFASWEFNGAVGELRGAFGIQIASIAAQYGIGVEDDLAKILLGEDDPTET